MPLTRSVVVAMCAVPGEPSAAVRWLVSRLGISMCEGAMAASDYVEGLLHSSCGRLAKPIGWRERLVM